MRAVVNDTQQLGRARAAALRRPLHPVNDLGSLTVSTHLGTILYVTSVYAPRSP
jgi:hypothetical protein